MRLGYIPITPRKSYCRLVTKSSAVVNAGGEMGFINRAKLIYDSKSKYAGYHDDMNSTNFNKWLQYQLIPNMPPGSIVILDNAIYHSVQENKPSDISSRKTKYNRTALSTILI